MSTTEPTITTQQISDLHAALVERLGHGVNPSLVRESVEAAGFTWVHTAETTDPVERDVFARLLTMKREMQDAGPRILASAAPIARALTESAERMARDLATAPSPRHPRKGSR